jgi:hypothetical protein
MMPLMNACVPSGFEIGRCPLDPVVLDDLCPVDLGRDRYVLLT